MLIILPKNRDKLVEEEVSMGKVVDEDNPLNRINNTTNSPG